MPKKNKLLAHQVEIPGLGPIPDKRKSGPHESRVEPVNQKAAIAELSKLLLEFAGVAEGLPADLAEQHDHYLHGLPRR